MNLIRTVLGDIKPAELGPGNCHEHPFLGSPLLVGDELVDEPSLPTEARLLCARGLDAMVDAIPIGLQFGCPPSR